MFGFSRDARLPVDIADLKHLALQNHLLAGPSACRHTDFALRRLLADERDLVRGRELLKNFFEVKELRPQSTPGIVHRPLVRRDIDRPLLAALLQRWQHRYQTLTPTWEDTALFRSLNMANAASKIPASADGTNYDVGRSVGLWVSAFEVLVHNGKDKSGLFKVYENFNKPQWNLTKCKETRALRTPGGPIT